MRNEIVDEIVRAERIAGTLLLTAKQNATANLQKTNSSILDAQKKAVVNNKKLYKELLLEQEKQAKEEYDLSIQSCKNKCEELKQNCVENVMKVAQILADEVKK